MFDALKKAAGLEGNWAPPDHEPSIEDISIERANRILHSVTDEEFEQALRDWTTIGEVVKLSDAIDWHTVRKVLGVARTSSGQPPAPLDLFFASWRNPYARVFWLLGLIHFRRSPAHSQRISEILAWAGWALAQLPQQNHAGELAA